MRLNGWVSMFENIYFLSQNFERDRFRVFSHLVEVTGGLTQASIKLSDYERSQLFLAKVFAWYCALLKAVNLTAIEDVVWAKFPRRCPYCLGEVCTCGSRSAKPELDAAAVRRAALLDVDHTPADLYAWQLMFNRIYAQRSTAANGLETREQARSSLQRYAARFVEELGEVSEAMRLEYFYPEHLRNELADVFAWTCGIANILPLAFGVREPLFLADLVWGAYPNRCPHCEHGVCTCRLEPVREAISQAGVFSSTGIDSVTGVYTRDRFTAEFNRHVVNADQVTLRRRNHA